ncbi:MAG TPA: tetratricopeptide repeat protein [Candidatus Sulfotelmatobacter sp.]|jgi:tetratricopeptide (TPR) repeat protein|nr:tetratricopeptide repeat protein [Candidatus Sulfotelmatobacter sp.]
MFVVTFYSYKGGVGRTSALVNVAYRLARRGKRVFVLDFDLEAPGIDSYGLVETDPNTPGLVEYISTFTATRKVPDLREFVRSSSLPDIAGKLFVMRGGRKDNNYKSALGLLDWKVLYRQRKGFLLIENLKGAIENLFKPDYLLVDARTGLTDISGICTLQLPHLVVLLFSLNEQSINGVSDVLRSIVGNKLNREIATMLVASPVPDMSEWVDARSKCFETARKAMGRPADVVIPYAPFLAFGEFIVDGQGQNQSQLGRAYDLLADNVIAENSSDIVTLLSRATELVKEGQHDLAESHYRALVDANSNSVEAWMEFGKFERLRRRLQPATQYFEKAYALAPADCEVLAQLAQTYAFVDEAKCKRYFGEFLECDRDAQRIDRVSSALLHAGLKDEAVEGFMRAATLDYKNVHAQTSLGEACMHVGRHREGAEAYRRGLEIDPNNLVCAFNLGRAYQKLDDPRAIEYYRKAIDIFEQTRRPEEKLTLANTYESMSRAYLLVGKPQKAIQLLQESIAIAKELPNARIYSSATYERVPQAKFILELSSRLLRISRKNIDINSEKSGQGEPPLN